AVRRGPAAPGQDASCAGSALRAPVPRNPGPRTLRAYTFMCIERMGAPGVRHNDRAPAGYSVMETAI
ncbi:hypothetical protein ABZ371_22355, partial [Streptomyces sp. NPDC005899]|uniref:hypothetical protein n=1 Tax=Streptomyces sp. NPDC005899 TaxID=3155716 RepID=UPI003402EA86